MLNNCSPAWQLCQFLLLVLLTVNIWILVIWRGRRALLWVAWEPGHYWQTFLVDSSYIMWGEEQEIQEVEENSWPSTECTGAFTHWVLVINTWYDKLMIWLQYTVLFESILRCFFSTQHHHVSCWWRSKYWIVGIFKQWTLL